MNCDNRLFVFLLLFIWSLSGSSGNAQTAAAASPSEVQELRETVHELGLRVSALEEELKEQRGGTSMQTAPLNAGMSTSPVVDVRSSVESVSSSSVAETVAAAATKATATQSAPAAS